MLVGRNELVNPAARKEGGPAFTARPLQNNKLTCSLVQYGALTQLVEVLCMHACQLAVGLNYFF